MQFTHIRNPTLDDIGKDHLAFLSHLDGPTVIHLEGSSSNSCRVLVTLLHANEPSGFKAVYRLIKEQLSCFARCKIIIASVIAARTEPIFTHRMLPGSRDLNRCFGQRDNQQDTQSRQWELASAIADFIDSVQPEAVIDLHNTSGSGPAFCVSIADHLEHKALASLFTPRLIKTDIRLGAIMERDFSCPIITVEAGGSQDAAADQIAYQGLQKFFTSADIFTLSHHVEVISSPKRLEIKPEVSIGFEHEANEVHHITMRKNIERLNFGVTLAGESLGWINHGNLDLFKLDNPTDQTSDYFEVRNNEIITRRDLTLFMVTTRADIAKSDCLFYFALI